MCEDVIRVFKESRKLYGTRKIKAALKSQGKTISKRRIAKIMKKHQLKSTYRKAKYRLHKPKVIEAEVPNILERNFNLPSLDRQQKVVGTLDRFDALCNSISEGLPAEIEARQKQCEYYRDRLLTFNPISNYQLGIRLIAH